MHEENPFEEAVKEFSQRKGLQIRTIVIPATELLDDLYHAIGVKSFDELFPTQKDLDEALLSWINIKVSVQDFKDRLIDGIRVLRRDNIRLSVAEKEKTTKVYYIEGMILSKKARASLDQRLVFSGRGSEKKKSLSSLEINEYERMPRDVFHHLVLTGGIKGKDLISLCLASKNLQKKCNEPDGLLFKKLLEKEFGIKNYRDYGRTPREAYFRQHRHHVQIFWSKDTMRMQTIIVAVRSFYTEGAIQSQYPEDEYNRREFDLSGDFIDVMTVDARGETRVFLLCIMNNFNEISRHCTIIRFDGDLDDRQNLRYVLLDERFFDMFDFDPIPELLSKGLLIPFVGAHGPDLVAGPTIQRHKFNKYTIVAVPLRHGMRPTRFRSWTHDR